MWTFLGSWIQVTDTLFAHFRNLSLRFFVQHIVGWLHQTVMFCGAEDWTTSIKILAGIQRAHCLTSHFFNFVNLCKGAFLFHLLILPQSVLLELRIIFEVATCNVAVCWLPPQLSFFYLFHRNICLQLYRMRGQYFWIVKWLLRIDVLTLVIFGLFSVLFLALILESFLGFFRVQGIVSHSYTVCWVNFANKRWMKHSLFFFISLIKRILSVIHLWFFFFGSAFLFAKLWPAHSHRCLLTLFCSFVLLTHFFNNCKVLGWFIFCEFFVDTAFDDVFHFTYIHQLIRIEKFQL